MREPQHALARYIRSTPRKVWDAITQPKSTKPVGHRFAECTVSPGRQRGPRSAPSARRNGIDAPVAFVSLASKVQLGTWRQKIRNLY